MKAVERGKGLLAVGGRLEGALGVLFGCIFLGLSVVVAVETVVRKLFNVSLQGADELGGYALAVGSTLAFTLALIGRSHIRVDLLYGWLSPRSQRCLNLFSILSLALFAGFAAWIAWNVVTDTVTYGSAAPTPWGTPLVYPQSVWLVSLLLFALAAAGLAVRGVWLLLSGRVGLLDHEFQPKSVKDELQEELDSLNQRSSEKEGTA